jgi:hypothetical protein
MKNVKNGVTQRALFSDWALQQEIWLYQGLGGEEDPAPHYACKETPWLRLEQVEQGLDLYHLGSFR